MIPPPLSICVFAAATVICAPARRGPTPPSALQSVAAAARLLEDRSGRAPASPSVAGVAAAGHLGPRRVQLREREHGRRDDDEQHERQHDDAPQRPTRLRCGHAADRNALRSRVTTVFFVASVASKYTDIVDVGLLLDDRVEGVVRDRCDRARRRAGSDRRAHLREARALRSDRPSAREPRPPLVGSARGALHAAGRVPLHLHPRLPDDERARAGALDPRLVRLRRARGEAVLRPRPRSTRAGCCRSSAGRWRRC